MRHALFVKARDMAMTSRRGGNGSDHGVVASYLEIYEEGEVEHINGVWPDFLLRTANFNS